MDRAASMAMRTCGTHQSITCKSLVTSQKRACGWVVSVWLVVGSVCGGGATASTSTFDEFVEGALDTSFTSGGVTFFDLDDRAGGTGIFTIEQADGTLSGPGFSPPNALGFGGWVPGPDAAFSQCGSFKFTTGSVQDYASVEVFEWMSYAGNTISLEAYRNGVMVNSMTVDIPGNFQINHWSLTVSGVAFDTLRVNGAGPTDRGVFFGLVDNVLVSGSGVVCTGNEQIKKARCEDRTGANLLKVILVGGLAGDTFTVRLTDGSSKSGLINSRGKGKAKFTNRPAGDAGTVTAEWGCGAVDERTYSCP
ncbi:MAG: hypothetical protein IT449_03520 [Phycisphaerales bacterium]|nr:hypothetical protein [Phycisphaerales bacterium]